MLFSLFHRKTAFSRTTWVHRYQKGKTSLDLNEARDDGVLGCSGPYANTSLQADNHNNTSSLNLQAGHSPVSRRQQITLRATLISHLIDGLLSTTWLSSFFTAHQHIKGHFSAIFLPRLRTKFGERAFSHAGPATWNALLDHIRTVANPVKFWKLLKSQYFSQAFNICRWFFVF